MALLTRRSGGAGSVRPGIGLPSARHGGSSSDAINTAMSSQSALLRAASGEPRPVVVNPLSVSTANDVKTADGPLSPPGTARPLEVLLVEDIKVSQKAAQKALERLGYKVAVASDGESAVTQFRNGIGTFGLVLMDIGVRTHSLFSSHFSSNLFHCV
jgi:PleD family two-component response regulator